MAKAALDRQTLRDRQRQDKVRLDNIARLKSRQAEKVKRLKEGSAVRNLENEVVSSLPQMVRRRVGETLAREQGLKFNRQDREREPRRREASPDPETL